jgi:phospholipase/carboxylesterase
MPGMRREKIAELDAIVTGDDDAPGKPLVVLLHGFGAPADDLEPLAEALNVSAETRFIFPAAPHSVESGFDGRAWWMIDMMKLQMSLITGNLRDLAKDIPEGLDEARAQMLRFLDEVEARYRPSKWVLGGFSQGAMLSLDVLLHLNNERDKMPQGLVLLSGTLLAEEVWLPRMAAKKSVPIFQSHGTHDPILPFSSAELLRDHLTQAGASVEWVPFRGQHEIPSPVLRALGAFLTRTLS